MFIIILDKRDNFSIKIVKNLSIFIKNSNFNKFGPDHPKMVDDPILIIVNKLFYDEVFLHSFEIPKLKNCHR